MFSTIFLGKSLVANELIALSAPGIISDFPLNMPFSAIAATASGCIPYFSEVALIACKPALSIKLVFTGPGERQVTDTVEPFSSCLNPLVKSSMKALEAAYRLNVGTAW